MFKSIGKWRLVDFVNPNLLKGRDCMKKITVYCVITLMILFGCYNLIWYFGAYKPYNDLQDSFPEIEESGVKIYADEDNFQYSVNVPDYLLWNGNLAITEQDIQYALIIWMEPFKSGFSQGILFNGYNNLNAQIMLKNRNTAEVEEDQQIVDNNNTVISMLFDKANEVWMLGLE